MSLGPVSVRRWALPAGLPAFLLLAGCGFHLAGTVQHLPPAMAHTCIQSEEPYGHLENLLRNAIRQYGDEASETCTDKSATLAIIKHTVKRRVLAVNAQGQPQEYLLTYRVTFSLNDSNGKTLLPVTTIRLQRQQAYAVINELGAGRRHDVLVRDMQREASQLILFRLEALERATPAPAKN